MTTHPMDEHYRELAAGIVFRLRQLADEIEAESSDHIAASLAAEWGDTTHGVMELLQKAEAIRAIRWVDARNASSLRPTTHTFAPAKDDPGCCVVCGRYDSEHTDMGGYES